MSYPDEKIIELKKAARNLQFKDIETTGIYIKDNLVLFEKQFFWNNKLCIFMPNSFIDMPEAVSQMKYPSVDRPQVIKSSLDTTANFCINLVNQIVSYDQVEELAEQLKQVLKTTNPDIKFDWEDAVDTKSKNRVSLFEFTNNGVDERIYNLFCVMDISDGVIQGSFNCIDKDAEQWKDAARSVFSKMEEIKKK